MTKEQEKAIYRLNLGKNIPISSECCIVNVKDIETVLSMLEEKEKIIGLYIDNIMTHQQVKTIRKMCCPSCPIGEKACTYSGIHRNCIKQYFENKVKERR